MTPEEFERTARAIERDLVQIMESTMRLVIHDFISKSGDFDLAFFSSEEMKNDVMAWGERRLARTAAGEEDIDPVEFAQKAKEIALAACMRAEAKKKAGN